MDEGEKDDDGANKDYLMKLSRVRENVDEILNYIIHTADDIFQPFCNHFKEFRTGIIKKQQERYVPSRRLTTSRACSSTSTPATGELLY